MKVAIIVITCLILFALVFPFMNDFADDAYTDLISPIASNTTATIVAGNSTGTVSLYYGFQGFIMSYIWWIISMAVIAAIVVAVARNKQNE